MMFPSNFMKTYLWSQSSVTKCFCFSWEFDTPLAPCNANNFEMYTFVTVFLEIWTETPPPLQLRITFAPSQSNSVRLLAVKSTLYEVIIWKCDASDAPEVPSTRFAWWPHVHSAPWWPRMEWLRSSDCYSAAFPPQTRTASMAYYCRLVYTILKCDIIISHLFNVIY